MPQPPIRDSASAGDTALGLFELIAMLWVIEEVGEIREQVQAVVQQKAGCAHRRGPGRVLIVRVKALAVRLPAIASIDETEPGNQTFGDGAFRHLIRRFPVGPIADASQREPVTIVTTAVPQNTVDLAVIVRPYARSVVVVHFERAKQIAAAYARRGGTEEASPSVISCAGSEDGTFELIDVVDIGCTGGRKIALVREVRSLLELHPAHEFRNEKAHVRIPMSVRTRRCIDGNSGDGRRKVRAVIQVEASEVVLIRLALATMLAHDEAWHGFKNFATAHDRSF